MGNLGVKGKLKFSFAKRTRQRTSCKELLPSEQLTKPHLPSMSLVYSNSASFSLSPTPRLVFHFCLFWVHINTSTHTVWCDQWFLFTIPVSACFRLALCERRSWTSFIYMLSTMSDKFQVLLPPIAVKN